MTPTRLLHLSDTHLGMARWARGQPTSTARRDDYEHALNRALEPARRGEVDLVVHSGDLFNRSRPPRAVAARVAEILVALARQVPVVLIAGNHDRRGLRRHLPFATPGLHVIDVPTRVRVGSLTLACVPFRRVCEAFVDAARRAWGPGADLLVAHQAFHGARVPNFTFRVGVQRDTIGEAHLPRGVRHVLCGHLHPRQALQIGEAEVVCPGSTERTAFSERDQVKGYALWELEQRVRWRFVDLPARPMHLVGERDAIAAVPPGALVRLVGPLAGDAEAERALLGCGAWVVTAGGPRVAPVIDRGAQLPLFG